MIISFVIPVLMPYVEIDRLAIHGVFGLTRYFVDYGRSSIAKHRTI
ncbi:MAG: hypothetical protein PHC95_12360 [Parabacteroides sp.]|nr:hypothetical protein [Parabacteroides sp.]